MWATVTYDNGQVERRQLEPLNPICEICGKPSDFTLYTITNYTTETIYLPLPLDVERECSKIQYFCSEHKLSTEKSEKEGNQWKQN